MKEADERNLQELKIKVLKNGTFKVMTYEDYYKSSTSGKITVYDINDSFSSFLNNRDSRKRKRQEDFAEHESKKSKPNQGKFPETQCLIQ